MDILRFVVGGIFLLFGLFIVVSNYVRLVSNSRNRDKNGRWSSPAPIIGPVFIIAGYAALPIEFSGWAFLAFILDPDTVMTAVRLPSLIKALRE